MPKSRPLAERFNEKVAPPDENGCHLWTAGTDACGYGKINIGRGSRRGASAPAHRVSWELHVGPIPDGLCVCHHCDVPACTAIEHLFLGTHADNMADMMAKGRARGGACLGENHGQSKLTADNVREIRRRWPGETQLTLAREFGVRRSNISIIVNRKAWRHIS